MERGHSKDISMLEAGGEHPKDGVVLNGNLSERLPQISCAPQPSMDIV